MESDAAVLQQAELVHDFARAGVAQHLHAHLRVGDVHGYVQRADAAADDAIQLRVVNVGHGDVVAHHQRQSPVVILDIERLAHAGRHLVDEAEDAVILARAGIRHDGLIQRQAQRLPIVLPDMQREGFAATADLHIEAGAGCQRLIIYLVDDRFPGNGLQQVTGMKADALGDGAGLNVGDGSRQGSILLREVLLGATQTSDAHIARIIHYYARKSPKSQGGKRLSVKEIL